MTGNRLVPGLLLVLLSGCGDTRHLLSLGAELNREFPDTKVGVSLTDGLILTVNLIDSPLLLASCATQTGLAMRVATFTRDHYQGFDSLYVFNVAFTTRRSPDSIPRKAVRLPFRFAPAAVRAGLTGSDSARQVASCIAYEELQ